MQIKRQYIVDESDRKVAVQLDIDTFSKIEAVLEDCGLVQFMTEDDSEDEMLDIEQARSY
jgi:hypothetical protein